MTHYPASLAPRAAAMAETGLAVLVGRARGRRILERVCGTRSEPAVDAEARRAIEHKIAGSPDRQTATIETILTLADTARQRLDHLAAVLTAAGDRVDLQSLTALAARLHGVAEFLDGRHPPPLPDSGRDAAADAVRALEAAAEQVAAERARHEHQALRRQLDTALREADALRTAYAISRQVADDARAMIAVLIETDSRYDQPSTSLIGDGLTRTVHDSAGWSTLRDVARLSAAELLQIHGIGQQRLQRLRAHFASQAMPCLFAAIPFAETLQQASREPGPVTLHAMPTVIEQETGDTFRLPLMVGPEVTIVPG